MGQAIEAPFPLSFRLRASRLLRQPKPRFLPLATLSDCIPIGGQAINNRQSTLPTCYIVPPSLQGVRWFYSSFFLSNSRMDHQSAIQWVNLPLESWTLRSTSHVHPMCFHERT